MIGKQVRVGKTVDGWCSKCLRVLEQRVLTVSNGVIASVRCNTCKSEHSRATSPRGRAAGRPRGRVTAPRRGRPRSETPERQRDYAALLRGRTKASARRYSSTTRFAIGDVVSHGAFGLGVVTAERDYAKIDILFADGPKVLLQGR